MENKAPTFGEIPETLLRIKNFAKNKKSKKMLIYIFCNIFIIFFIIVFLSYFSFTKLIFHKKRRRKVFHKKSERNLIKNDKSFDLEYFYVLYITMKQNMPIFNYGDYMIIYIDLL